MEKRLNIVHSFTVLVVIIICLAANSHFITMSSSDYDKFMEINNQIISKNSFSIKEPVLYVSTFDGIFVAISYKTGDILWKLTNKFQMFIESQYFNSDFNNDIYFSNSDNNNDHQSHSNITRKFHSNYTINNEYLVPSLDGLIYHFKNNKYRIIDGTQSDFMSDYNTTTMSNYIRSTVDLLLIGVDPWNGRIYYECNGADCNYTSQEDSSIIDHYDHHIIEDENIDFSTTSLLIIEYQTHRRFNTNLKHGHINWNMSHNSYTLRFIDNTNSFPNEDSFNSTVDNNLYTTNGKNLSEYTNSASRNNQPNTCYKKNANDISNWLRYDALTDILENIDKKWSIRFKSPIVGLWYLCLDNGLTQINLRNILHISRIKDIVKNISINNEHLCGESLLLFSFKGQPYFVPILSSGHSLNFSDQTSSASETCYATIYTISELLSDELESYDVDVPLNNIKTIGYFDTTDPIDKVTTKTESLYNINQPHYYKIQSFGSFQAVDNTYYYNPRLLPAPFNDSRNQLSADYTDAEPPSYGNRFMHTLKYFGIVGSLITVFYNTIYFCMRKMFERFRRLPESSPLTVRKGSSSAINLLDSDESCENIQQKLSSFNQEIINSRKASQNNASNVATSETPSNSMPVTISRYMSDFIHIKKLAKGGFGHVYMAKNIIDQCEYAIKRIRLPECSSARIRVMREVQALAKLNHPGVVRFYNAWFEPTINVQDQDNSKKTKIIPLCPVLRDDSELSLCSDEENASQQSISDHLSSKNNNKSSIIDVYNPFVIPHDAMPCISSTSHDSSDGSYPASVAAVDYPKNDNDLSLHNENECSHKLHIDLYIQMQLCKPETLHDWLANNITNRDISLCISYFKQILEAISYIHSQDFIHRDLKPSNIFFSMDGVVKIGDFGLVTHTLPSPKLHESAKRNFKKKKNSRISVSFSNDDINLHYYTKLVGTELYMAPEQANCEKYDDTVDIYALALILTELVLPFRTQTERYITLNRMKVSKKNDELDQNYPTVAQLVDWMLSNDPKNRPTAKDIIDSDLVKSLWSKYNLS